MGGLLDDADPGVWGLITLPGDCPWPRFSERLGLRGGRARSERRLGLLGRSIVSSTIKFVIKQLIITLESNLIHEENHQHNESEVTKQNWERRKTEQLFMFSEILRSGPALTATCYR